MDKILFYITGPETAGFLSQHSGSKVTVNRPRSGEPVPFQVDLFQKASEAIQTSGNISITVDNKNLAHFVKARDMVDSENLDLYVARISSENVEGYDLLPALMAFLDVSGKETDAVYGGYDMATLLSHNVIRLGLAG